MSIPLDDNEFPKYVSVDSILFENPQKEHSKLISSLANKDDFHALQIKATYATSSQLRMIKTPTQPHTILNLSDEDSTNPIGQESQRLHDESEARRIKDYGISLHQIKGSEFLNFYDSESNPGIIRAQGERSVNAITQGASKPAMVSKMVQVDFTDYKEANIDDHKRYKCTLCDKKFKRPSSLKTHMFSHTGEKPYSCQAMGCRKRFSVLSNLRRHSKIHQTAG
ncbi:hypothetical protein K7432_002365 [Basidiobolus ranarum]|uniref:C2H2-type domain-containing protein n=1 Tax=Basidiobolus ranarum TaxID=34480 RepID=A0ABR2W7Y6_9FUNG